MPPDPVASKCTRKNKSSRSSKKRPEQGVFLFEFHTRFIHVISGYLEMLDEGEVELTPERMEIIKTELGHLRRLVGDLTTLTQVEAHELEIEMLSVLPSVFLEQIYRTYQPIAARQGADLVLSLSERAPLIRPDESRMLQVL